MQIAPDPGKEKEAPPAADPGDDLSAAYLLGRQLAGEYHSLAVQSILHAGPERYDTSSAGIERQLRLNEERLSPEGRYAEMAAARGASPREIAAETGGLEAPMADPTMAGAGAFGGAGKIALGMGMKLMPSLGRALTSGAVGAAAEYPLGVANEAVASEYPSLSLPFAVASGMLSGATIESAIERGIVRAAAAAGRKLSPDELLRQVQAAKYRFASQSGQAGGGRVRGPEGFVTEGLANEPHEVRLSELVPREAPSDPARLSRAREKFLAGVDGTGAKREPIQVVPVPGVGYKVLDGNSTYHVLKDMGAESAVVTVGPVRQKTADIGELYRMHEAAAPEFRSYTEQLAGEFGGKMIFRPGGLKARERATEKALKERGGKHEYLTDILASTVVFDTEDGARRAFDALRKNPEVFRAKDRFSSQTPHGYRDYSLIVRLPGSEVVAEVQLTTPAMAFAKEVGPGHLLYELSQFLERRQGVLNKTEKQLLDEVNSFAKRYYDKAATADSITRFQEEASSLVNSDAFKRILALAEESVTSQGLEGSPIKKILPDLSSMYKPEFESKAWNPFTRSLPMESPPSKEILSQRQAEIKAAREAGQARPLTEEDSASVIGEINAEIANQPVGTLIDIIKNQRGELVLIGGKKPGSGAPEPGTPPHKALPAALDQAAAAPPALEKYAGNINLHRIDSPEAVKAVIDGTAKVYAPELDDARRGVRTWDMTEAEAKNYTLDDLLGRKIGQAYNAAQVENARGLLVASSTNVKQLADKVRAGLATDIDKYEFARALNLHYAIQAQVAGAAAEAGRALQVFRKIAQNDQLKLAEIKETLSATNSPATIAKMADAIAAMRTPAQVSAFVPKAMRAKTKDMFLEVWINGLLSGPQTHVVNMLSNLLVAATQIPERMLAAQVGRLRGAAREITEGEVVAQTFGALQGVKDGLKLAFRALASGEPTDPRAKIETRARRAITAENVRELPVIKKLAPDALQQGGALARAVDFIGEAARSPGRALMAEDEFFKAVGYRSELHARAFRKAHVEEGLSGKAAAARIQEILSDPEIHAPDVHLAAVDAARYQTFTSKLDSRLLSAIAGSANPLVRIVFPFVSTPTNILRYIGERTPFAVLMRGVREDLMAGGARADMALARIAAGSMLSGLAAWGVSAGIITGSGPSDRAQRAHLTNRGWQQDSIKIGGTYYSYGRLEPLGGLIGIAATAAELMGELGDEDRMTLAAGVAGAFGKYATSRTWLRGMSDLVHALDDPDRYGDRYLKKLLGSGIPALAAQAERVLSPEMKEVTDFIDALKARTPGWSEDLPRRRNLWGEAIRYEGGLGPDIVSPIYTSRQKDSPIDAELFREKIPIRMPRKVQTIQKVPVELTPQQYERFVVLMNETPLMSTGKVLKESLDELVTKDDHYRSLKDRDHKEMVIKAHMREAQALARERLLAEDPVLQRVVADLQQQRQGE